VQRRWLTWFFRSWPEDDDDDDDMMAMREPGDRNDGDERVMGTKEVH
jgi:hypothetical protein